VDVTAAPLAPEEFSAYQDEETCEENLCLWTVKAGWFIHPAKCESGDAKAVAPPTESSPEETDDDDVDDVTEEAETDDDDVDDVTEEAETDGDDATEEAE
jgi:hypothetical protein